MTGALIAVGSAAATTFRPTTAQLVVTVVVALAAVAAPFGMRRVPAAADVSPGSGLVGAVVTFVLLSLFHLGHEAGPPWFACTVMVVTLAVLGIALLRWRFPAGPVGAGVVAVYAWVGLANAAEHGIAAVAEQVVIVVLVLGALVLLFRPRPRTRTLPGASSSSRR